MYSSPFIAQDNALIFINDLPQSSINPAFDVQKKWTLGVGSYKIDMGNSGFTLNQAFKDEGDKKVLYLSEVQDKIDDKNTFRFNEQLKTIELAYKTGSLILSAGHSMNMEASSLYERDLIHLLGVGNTVGETMKLSPSFQVQSYNEFFLGLSKKWKNLRFGVRAKVINGAQNIQTDKNKYNLSTSDDIYQITVDSDLEILAANAVDYTSVDDYDVRLERFSTSSLFSNNWGAGLDFGISNNTGRIKWFVSVLDLGMISWDNDAHSYTIEGVHEYNGIDVVEFINSDQDYSVEDSLKALIDFKKTQKNYNSSLSPKFNVGAQFKLNQTYKMGAVASYTALHDGSDIYATVSIERPFLKWFDIGASISYRDKSMMNIGGHVTFDFGPIHLYALTSNALAAFAPESFRSMSLRVGGYLNI